MNVPPAVIKSKYKAGASNTCSVMVPCHIREAAVQGEETGINSG